MYVHSAVPRMILVCNFDGKRPIDGRSKIIDYGKLI